MNRLHQSGLLTCLLLTYACIMLCWRNNNSNMNFKIIMLVKTETGGTGKFGMLLSITLCINTDLDYIWIYECSTLVDIIVDWDQTFKFFLFFSHFVCNVLFSMIFTLEYFEKIWMLLKYFQCIIHQCNCFSKINCMEVQFLTLTFFWSCAFMNRKIKNRFMPYQIIMCVAGAILRYPLELFVNFFFE